MRHSGTRSLRPLEAALGLALVAFLASGCVTRSTYLEVEEERDKLSSRVRDLERSNASLGKERVQLLESMEDLRVEREQLSTDVAGLQRTKDRLEENLREREEQVEELSKLKSTYSGLVQELESELSAGQIQIEQLREGLRLNLSQDILFRSGAVSLEPHGQDVLRRVAKQLEATTHTIEVQGHTDDVPLSASLARRWGTNWELAGARASSVVRLLQEARIDPTRLTAISFGEHAPVESNETPEGRARNRRIEIRLKPVERPELPGEAAGSEPTSGEAAGSEPTSGEAAGSEPTSGQAAGSEPTSGEAAGSEPTSGQAAGSEPTSGDAEGGAAEDSSATVEDATTGS